MEYQVLARKWRPRNFSELVGQEHVARALGNGIEQNRLHHAYLFTGTRGVGKTTIARILAKCLNCDTGITAAPCGECTVCKEVDAGRFVDLIEIDAASRTGVDDVRELIDNAQYAPTAGRYKVYLIDEVHMFSNNAFNALLKTLEEPPPHVKFLLATTDPQKLPVTILSRCLQFNLKSMPAGHIVSHLQNILPQENIDFEEAALWSIADAANGSMRDALSLTDQAISFGAGSLKADEVSSMLGAVDRRFVQALMDALFAADTELLLKRVAEVAEHAPDWLELTAELITLLQQIAVAQAVPEACDDSRGDKDKILSWAESISRQDIQLYYQIALVGRRDLTLSPDLRRGFEMLLLRLNAFRPASIAQGDPSAKKPEVRQGPAHVQAIGGNNTSPVPPPTPEPTPSANHSAVVSSVKSVEDKKDVLPEANKTEQGDQLASLKPELPAKSVKPEPAPAPQLTSVPQQPQQKMSETAPEQISDNKKTVSSSDIKQQPWSELLQFLEVDPSIKSLAFQCELKWQDDNCATLLIPQRFATLAGDENLIRLEKALSAAAETDVSLKAEVSGGDVASPAVQEQKQNELAQQRAIDSFNNDPIVHSIVEHFDAEIQSESIKPISKEV